MHEIDLPTTTSNNSQSFIQVLTPVFFMTDPMQDSEGTQTTNPSMDSNPTKDIIPNNLGWQIATANTTTTYNDGFTTVGEKPPIQQMLKAKYGRVGMWISRQDSNNKSIHIDDLKFCFECIMRIDPTAIVMNHMKDPRTARPIAELTGPKMTSMDYNGFCDIQTFPWGKPQDGRHKTTMLCWIASNIITGDLKALRHDSNFQEFLKLGNCTLQSSTLHESRSRMIGLFMGKDPNHTQRKDLCKRMQEHLKQYAGSMDIPVNVVPFTEFGIKTLGFTVGLKHEAKVKQILKAHPFEDIEIILNVWKRSNPTEYENRVRQHAEICKQSTAFKLRCVDPELGVYKLRMDLSTSDARLDVVDVFAANHSDGTGVCYVQYLRKGRDMVLRAIKEAMSDMEKCATFSSEPVIVNEDASHAPTRVSGFSTGTNKASLPVSKWASIPAKDIPKPAPKKSPTIPRTVALTPPRAFSAAMRKPRPPSPQDDLSDDRSDRTPRTRNSGGSGGTSTLSSRGSTKTPREVQLEHENQQLKKEFSEVKNVLTKIQTQHEQQMSQMQAVYQEQLKLQQAQISSLQQNMAHLQQIITSQATAPAPPPETPRKKPPNKKQKGSQSPSVVEAAMSQISQMAVTAVNTMAPQQQPAGMEPMLNEVPTPAEGAVIPQDVPMGEQQHHV